MKRTVFLLLALGCAPLDAIDGRGVCGNDVLEPDNGEFCDGEATLSGYNCGTAEEASCQFVFSAANGCPPGFSSANEEGAICKLPTGRFEAAESLELRGRRLRTLDFDGDGAQDLVAATGEGVTVAFGGDSQLASRLELAALSEPRRLGVGDANADGRLDLLIASAIGLEVVRGNDERRPDDLVPFSSPPLTGESLRAVSLHPEGEMQPRVLMFVEATSGPSLQVWADPDFEEVELGTDPPDVLLGPFRVGRSIATLPEREDGPMGDLLAFTAYPLESTEGGRAGPEIAILATLARSETGWRLRIRDSFEVPGRLGSAGAFLADFDLDGAPEWAVVAAQGEERSTVLVRTPGPDGPALEALGGPRYRGVGEVARCGPEGNCPQSAGRRGVSLQLIADLDGDGVPDFVNRGGVHLSTEDGLTRIFSKEPPWGTVRAADVDGDGRVDLIGQEPDLIQVLRNDGDSFDVTALPIDAEVGQLAAGDFDGDGSQDIVITETPDTLVGFFDGPEGPASTRVLLGRLAAIDTLVVAPDDDARDGLDDLLAIVAEAPVDEPEGRLWIAELESDGSRRLSAHIAPRFGEIEASAVAQVDENEARLVVVEDGRNASCGPNRLVIQTVDVIQARTDAPDDPCACMLSGRRAVARAMDMDADGVEEILIQAEPTGPSDAAGPYSRILRWDGQDMGCASAPPPSVPGIEKLSGEPGSRIPVRELEVGDLDGDGFQDVLLSLDDDGVRPSPPGGTAIFVRWGAANALSAPPEAELFVLTSTRTDQVPDSDVAENALSIETRLAPGDRAFGHLVVAVADLDGRPGAELVHTTRGTLRVSRLVRGEGRLEPVDGPLSLGEAPESLAVLDVDEDGLEDVLVATGARTLVLRQLACSAGDQRGTGCR